MLTPRELRLVEGAGLAPRKPLRGAVRGERLTRARGTSTEFRDFREYAPGDDLRHLDWNVLARLDSPVMRTYRDEEDLVAKILVDVSPSMDFGAPTKRETAARYGAAFALTALAGGDAATLEPLGLRTPPGKPLRGRGAGPRALKAATELARVEGKEALALALRARLLNAGRPTLAVVLSDGLDPDAPSVLRAAAGRGHEVWMVQILAPGERNPDLEGDLRLVDSEGGPDCEITANRAVIAEYKANLDAHSVELEAACVRGGGRFVQIASDEGLEEVAMAVFRRLGWWR